MSRELNEEFEDSYGYSPEGEYDEDEIEEMIWDAEVGDPDKKTLQGKNNNGCYVATCVYGSYDTPEVWTLRRFRDYRLAETWYGRAFIRTYYAISPTIVMVFGNTHWFKHLWKSVLDRKVAALWKKGYSSVKYNDRNTMKKQ